MLEIVLSFFKKQETNECLKWLYIWLVENLGENSAM